MPVISMLNKFEDTCQHLGVPD